MAETDVKARRRYRPRGSRNNRLTARVGDDLAHALELEATATGIPKAEIIERALRAKLRGRLV